MNGWLVVDEMLKKQGVYHGIPIGFGSVDITTSSPWLQKILDGMELDPSPDSIDVLLDRGLVDLEPESGYEMVNQWETKANWRGQRGTVYVIKELATGKARKIFIPEQQSRIRMFMDTVGLYNTCSFVEAERVAERKLKKLLSRQQKQMYYVSGCFMEEGRSGMSYILRKGKPTLAMRRNRVDDTGQILCALCLHSLGYYTGSWAGVLPPSDEVMVHLLHIRADEHFFWRKANHIPLHSPRSGL